MRSSVDKVDLYHSVLVYFLSFFTSDSYTRCWISNETLLDYYITTIYKIYPVHGDETCRRIRNDTVKDLIIIEYSLMNTGMFDSILFYLRVYRVN